MVVIRLKLKSLRFHKGNITFLNKQVFMVNMVRFPSRNQQVLSSSLIITIGKTSTVKNLNKSEIVISRVNQRLISISQIQKYPDLQDISTSHHFVR